MNNVSIVGRLTSDPNLVVLDSGYEMTKFNVAVDRRMSVEKKVQSQQEGKQTADFPRISVWGGLAKICCKYLEKGMEVAVTGEIRTFRKESEAGHYEYVTEILANRIKFLGKNDKKTFIEAETDNEALDKSEMWDNVEIEEY